MLGQAGALRLGRTTSPSKAQSDQLPNRLEALGSCSGIEAAVKAKKPDRSHLPSQLNRAGEMDGVEPTQRIRSGQLGGPPGEDGSDHDTMHRRPPPEEICEDEGAVVRFQAPLPLQTSARSPDFRATTNTPRSVAWPTSARTSALPVSSIHSFTMALVSRYRFTGGLR